MTKQETLAGLRRIVVCSENRQTVTVAFNAIHIIENQPATSLADSCSIGDVAEVKGGSQDGVVIAKDSLWQFISRLETELEMFESGDIHSHNLGCTKLKLDIRILKGLGGVS